jgi:hypothetical protein
MFNTQPKSRASAIDEGRTPRQRSRSSSALHASAENNARNIDDYSIKDKATQNAFYLQHKIFRQKVQEEEAKRAEVRLQNTEKARKEQLEKAEWARVREREWRANADRDYEEHLDREFDRIWRAANPRLAEEREARRRKEEKEARRLKEEKEARKREEEKEARRLKEEKEAARQREEEKEARRLKEEKEAQRKEEAARKREEEKEAQRKEEELKAQRKNEKEKPPLQGVAKTCKYPDIFPCTWPRTQTSAAAGFEAAVLEFKKLTSCPFPIHMEENLVGSSFFRKMIRACHPDKGGDADRTRSILGSNINSRNSLPTSLIERLVGTGYLLKVS